MPALAKYPPKAVLGGSSEPVESPSVSDSRPEPKILVITALPLVFIAFGATFASVSLIGVPPIADANKLYILVSIWALRSKISLTLFALFAVAFVKSPKEKSVFP